MSLEDRIRRIEDRIEIAELRYEYCYRIDDRDWDGFTVLFTPDATLDFGPVGTFEGTEEIREFSEHVVGANHPFLSHMLHNPVITTDGDAATGRWYVEVPCTFEDGSAGWIQGRYNDRYRRVEGTWRFAEIVMDFNYLAPYDEGWADIVAAE